jgi:DNA-directed RNA polymerase specialized sigma24 family protein
MLGSLAEADDAVQESWLHLSRTGTSGGKNLGGRLTTVVVRVCLAPLRSRESRRVASLGEHMPNPIASQGPHRPRARTRWRTHLSWRRPRRRGRLSLKDAPAAELYQPIKAGAVGQSQSSPKAAARLVRSVVAPARVDSLSTREVDVLRVPA